jgi:hypothetical protein
MLARQPGAEGVGLLTTERGIIDYLDTLDGIAKQSARAWTLPFKSLQFCRLRRVSSVFESRHIQ